MKSRVIIHKHEGETPLQALEKYRSAHSELTGIPMTYAGRLDPMASGALLLLIGDECKNRDAYTRLDKRYTFDVLFGVSSDTGDILGVVSASSPTTLTQDMCAGAIKTGTRNLPYPAFSSRHVNGIPLFQHALNKTIGTIEIPRLDMTVRSIECLSVRNIDSVELLPGVEKRLGVIQESAVNDFRRGEVLVSWQRLTSGEYTVATYDALVSSGTYIRTLAEEAGKALGVPALAYSIQRTQFAGLAV